MSFKDDEISRLGRLAVATWPSQATRKHPHVLGPELAVENLHADVRDSVRCYFDRYAISWWLSKAEGNQRKQLGLSQRLPSGHLNSSQVVCVNHLEPARVDFEMALKVARNLEPRVVDVRDSGEDGYIAFEWIGKREYLNEPGAFVRGRHVTSLDALMRVTLEDGTMLLLVIEWKYLESYGATSTAASKRGTDRVAIYRALLEAANSPLAPGDPSRLFYKPYDQLTRQTLLAARAVADPATPETEWLHVHVIPEGNIALRRRVRKAAPLLIGETLEETWRSALKSPSRYRIVTPSTVVKGDVHERWRTWRRCLSERYLT